MAEQRIERKKKSRAPSLAPLYAGVFVAIMAIVAVALGTKNDKNRAAGEAQDVPEEPEYRGNPFESGSGPEKVGSTGAPSPDDLLSSPAWIQATSTAEEALKNLRTGRAHRDSGSPKDYVRLGVLARDGFNQALDETVEWELDILDKYGENDPRVRAVQKKRAEWQTHRKKLRKIDMTKGSSN